MASLLWKQESSDSIWNVAQVLTSALACPVSGPADSIWVPGEPLGNRGVLFPISAY